MKYLSWFRNPFSPKVSHDEGLVQFREACRQFVILRMAYKLDRGDFDYQFDRFLAGDSLTINFNVSFLWNDVIFMRALSGLGNPEEIREKILVNWEREEK